jgi:LysM repeat protein
VERQNQGKLLSKETRGKPPNKSLCEAHVDNYLEKEISELRKEIADELGYTRKDKKDRSARPRQISRALRPYGRILILGGAGLLLAVVLLTLSSGGRNKRPPDNVTASKHATLDQLEQRIAGLEGLVKEIELLETHNRELQKSVAEINRTEGLISQRVDQLTQVVDELKKSMTSRSATIEAPSSEQGKPVATTEKSYYPEAPSTITRMPFSLPKSRYHEVRPGDTLYSIAQQYNLTVNELCRLNDMTPRQVIHPGQELLVAPSGDQ